MKRIIFLLSLVVLFAACNTFKKAQAPPHSSYADSISVVIFNHIHLGYDDMIASPDKSFIKWQFFYDSNINDISLLSQYDSSRTNNAAILKLTNDWRNRLIKYEAEHKNYVDLNNGQIIIYQDAMDNAGRKVYLTEKFYK